ncbi:MAG: hypothetical protein JSU70_15050 [Phycisphaerales bacterium]|nr:MAG: hypothetical protein JSU70_15050 [Phycisphaerales bacterium]
MSTKRAHIAVLLLVLGCLGVGIGADNSASPDGQTAAAAKPDEQLDINKNALLNGPSDEIRVKAATVMLFSENPLAREVLLDVLKRKENGAAQMAVCRALRQTRAAQQPVPNKDDFILPLLGVLTAPEGAELAKLAAEALLIFDYELISGHLERIVGDASLLPAARLNAIHALELRPDMKAAITLINLVDDPEVQVAAAAEKALQVLGIPVGRDSATRAQIVYELERKGRDEFLRDWLIRQEKQMRQMRAELKLWQEQYKSALDTIYDGISDDTAKGKILAEHLDGSRAAVKLWALEKVRQDRVGTRPNPKLPAEVGPILVKLIADQDRDVRLVTAKLLSRMGEVNSAQHLLAQLKVEKSPDVEMELFVALGGACWSAFLPNSRIKVPKETRKETLEWAVKYLSDQEAANVQKGAEVMKKLLEQDGLTPAEVDRYLGVLADSYARQKNPAGSSLRGDLLGAMAGLCVQGSACRAKAISLFKPLFDQALRDEAERVREAAVDGLIYIDKAAALASLRKDYVNDSSQGVRKKLINLAGEVGGGEDLDWLAEKIGSNSESEPAWQAMLRIFNGADAGLLNAWIVKLVSQAATVKLSDEQKISLLEIAERKVVSENRVQMIRDVREKLAHLYEKGGEFERAADYIGMLYKAATTAEEKDSLLLDLLNIYFKWPRVELAAKLVQDYLAERDLGPTDAIARSIEEHLRNPAAGVDPNVVLGALTKIEAAPAQNRPQWQERLKYWAKQLQPTVEPNRPKQPGS